MALEVALPVLPLLLAVDDTLTLPVLPLWATGEMCDTDPVSALEPLAAAATPVPTSAQNRPTSPMRTRFISAPLRPRSRALLASCGFSRKRDETAPRPVLPAETIGAATGPRQNEMTQKWLMLLVGMNAR